MKKIFLSILMASIIFANNNLTEAKIDDSQCKLGGITPGIKLTEVIKVFGQPDKLDINDEPMNRDAYYVYYGKSVMITLFRGSVDAQWKNTELKGKERVQGVTTSANNGFETPDGVKVGMSASDLNQIYGKPDYVAGNMHMYNGYFYGLKFWINNEKISAIEAVCAPDYGYKIYLQHKEEIDSAMKHPEILIEEEMKR